MAAHVLMDLDITDQQGFQEHLNLASPIVKQYGGTVIVGGATSQT